MTRATPIPDTVTLHVPFRVVKRGGRKEMQLPEGATQPRQDGQHAGQGAGARVPLEAHAGIGRVHHHRRTGRARGDRASSYMTRVLRLTLLAPDRETTPTNGPAGEHDIQS